MCFASSPAQYETLHRLVPRTFCCLHIMASRRLATTLHLPLVSVLAGRPRHANDSWLRGIIPKFCFYFWFMKYRNWKASKPHLGYFMHVSGTGFTTWIQFLVDLHPSSRIYDWFFWCHATWSFMTSISQRVLRLFCLADAKQMNQLLRREPSTVTEPGVPKGGGLRISASAPGLSVSAWIISNQILCVFLFFQTAFTPTTPWCGKVEGIPRNGHVNQANLGF